MEPGNSRFSPGRQELRQCLWDQGLQRTHAPTSTAPRGLDLSASLGRASAGPREALAQKRSHDDDIPS